MEEVAIIDGLRSNFGKLKDPRINRRKLHKLTDIIGISIIAVIGSAEGWEDIEEFCKSKEVWLRNFFELPNGIPSHDTISRVFQRIDSEEFEECFMEWVSSLREDSGSEVIAFDGKTVRRSFDRANEKSAIHLVSAFATQQRLILGQQKVNAKSNEITAIPKLIKMLDIAGSIVTIDAMGCQKEIAKKIREENADYVLALKDNHKNLHDDVKEFFANKEYKQKESQVFNTTESGHGRIEQRNFTLVSDLSSLCLKNEWKDLKTIGMVKSSREVSGKTSCETRYFLSSLELNVESFANAVRSHWAIENSMHWVLDVTFREDESRVRLHNAPQNLAIVRRIALNLTKSYQPPKPKSLKRKRKLAYWSDDYILNILFQKNFVFNGF